MHVNIIISVPAIKLLTNAMLLLCIDSSLAIVIVFGLLLANTTTVIYQASVMIDF